ncbi:hypothetical protein QW131_13675 [Roseibium salinum]|nr:hypothetical protein [Roseibium salinum]
MKNTSSPDLNAVWIDLQDPGPEEVAPLGECLGITIPDRADMEEIEISSRLYREKRRRLHDGDPAGADRR